MNHYKKIIDFSKKLIDTLDLDPTYVMLYGAKKDGVFDDIGLKRWILAYMYCYHAGITSTIASAPSVEEYWNRLRKADNEWHDRLFGSERRKGTRFLDGIEVMTKTFLNPEDAIDSLGEGTYSEISQKIGNWKHFGGWAQFKLADIMERVLEIPVKFSWDDLSHKAEDFEFVYPGKSIEEGGKELLSHLSEYKAPPRFERPLGISECETCICKFVSMCKRKYHIGKDIHEISEALNFELGFNPLAKKLRKYLPGN